MKTKRLAASLVLCAAILSCAVPAHAASSFRDITDAHTAVNADVLRLMGVVSGSGENRFAPDNALTRAEFSVMAVKVMGRGNEVPLHTTRTIFSDVTARHWARGYINLAASITVGGAQEGQAAGRLISGDGTGRFNPDAPITYAQAVTILMRMLGYSDRQAGSVWPAGYLNLAASIGLTRGLSAAPNQAITRGQAAQLFVNLLTASTESGQSYCAGLGSVRENVMLLSVNAVGDDGCPGAVRTSAGVFHPAVPGAVPVALQGTKGTLVLNDRSQVLTFIPDGSIAVTVMLAGDAQAVRIKGRDGISYSISSTTPAFTGADSDVSTWGELWMNLRAGAQVTLFMDGGKVIGVYYPSGGVSAQQAYVVREKLNEGSFHLLTNGSTDYAILKNNQPISVSDIQKYDVVTYDPVSNALVVSDLRLTCFYETAYPNPETPETITVLGHEFPVLESALDSIGTCKIGDRVSLLLTADGQVAGMEQFTAYARSTMAGLAGSSGVTVSLPNGQQIKLTGEIDESMQDQVVVVSGNTNGRLSAGIITGQEIPGDFRIAEMKLGALQVTAGVKVYEQVGRSAAVAISLADLDMETIPRKKIAAYRCNTSGMVDILILDGVTGDVYTYGVLRKGTAYQNLGGLTAENTTVRVENSGSGYPEVITGTRFEDGDFGGVVAGQREIGGVKVAAGLAQLTALSGVKRSDFFEKDGMWYVTVKGTVYPVAEQVETCIRSSGIWFDRNKDPLSAVRAYSNDMTVYIDSVGKKVRIIRAD